MFFSFIKNRFFTITIVILSCCFQSKTSASVSDRVRSTLQAEERQLLGNLISIFGLSFAEWQSFKNEYNHHNYSLYEQREVQDIQNRCKEQISQLLKQKILAIIAQSPISRPITVVRDHSPTGSDIIALQNTLIVDEERFNRNYPHDNHIQAIIWHEIMHIIHEDDLIMRCLAVLRDTALNSSNYSGWLRTWGDKVKSHFNEAQWQAAVVPWYQFRERRADLLSGLAHRANAPALIEVFKRFNSFATEKNDNLHPSMATRHSYMAQLESQLAQG